MILAFSSPLIKEKIQETWKKIAQKVLKRSKLLNFACNTKKLFKTSEDAKRFRAQSIHA